MPKDFGFGVHCGLRVFRVLASDFRFSQEIRAVFRFCYPMCFLVFLFCPIWVPVFLRFEQQLISNRVLFIYLIFI